MALALNPSPYPFLWDVTNNADGLAGAAVTIFTTEIESIANAAVIVSSVNGTSGVFTPASFYQAQWGDVFYNVGSPAYTATTTAGSCLSLWWLTTPDAGTTYESATAAPARPPDCVIFTPVAILPISGVYAARNVPLPGLQCKVLMQNNTGTTMPAGGTTAPYIKVAPYAMQY